MRALRTNKSGLPVSFSGIGGEEMRREGLSPIIGMGALSVMGLGDVIRSSKRIKGLIGATGDYICETNPDVVVTIDSKGFHFRVVQHVKKQLARRHCQNSQL